MTGKYAMPELELPSCGSHGNGGGTHIGFKVEVRSSYSQPTIIDNKIVIDNAWREFPIRPGATLFGANIPIKDWDADMLKHGIVSRVVAEAHLAALFAILEATRPSGALCVEARLVMVEYKYSYEIIEKGVTATILPPGSGHNMKVHPRPSFANELARPVDATAESEAV